MALITDNLDLCAQAIRDGKNVAFPTETVFGLGGNIYNEESIKNIFKVKERPYNDPLIVHVDSKEKVLELINLNKVDINLFNKMAEMLWPGPLTIILPKSDLVPDIVTSGLDKVGIRIPDNEQALEFLKRADVPIAAPSANKFCHVSPTHEEHVYDDLSESDILILKNSKEGEMIGIESTIIQPDFDEKKIYILRPGFITKNILEFFLETYEIDDYQVINRYEKLDTPGSGETHYAIDKTTFLVKNKDILEQLRNNKNITLIDFKKENYHLSDKFGCYHNLTEFSLISAMKNFYKILREIETNSTTILLIYFPKQSNEFYDSLYNRIIKSCSGNILDETRPELHRLFDL